MRNIYEKAVELMEQKEIDHNSTGTDLYLKVTKISRQLIKDYDFKMAVEMFIDQINHELWYDIPFAYIPAWEDKLNK